MDEIKCILIDDELEALQRLGTLLAKLENIKILGMIQDPADAVDQIINKTPDIVFLDVEMPKMSGFDVVEAIKTAGLSPTIVFATGYNQYAIKAIKAAAFDFLVKPVDIDELKECIRRFNAEGGRRIQGFQSFEQFNLSTREKEVLQLIIKGKSSKEISAELYIALSTVETHRKKILQKANVKSTPELISMILKS
jgi:DNA-binding NarL/FixJ family response regulator